MGISKWSISLGILLGAGIFASILLGGQYTMRLITAFSFWAIAHIFISLLSRGYSLPRLGAAASISLVLVLIVILLSTTI